MRDSDRSEQWLLKRSGHFIGKNESATTKVQHS
jgi:hypothetical protein